MRVLAITPWFPSAKLPGSGVFNLRDVELLAESHEVTVLHLMHPANQATDEPAESELLDGRVRVIRVPFTTGNPRLLLAARKSIREHAATSHLVHTMAMPALLPTRVARLQRPWVHTEHFSQLVTPPDSALAAVPLRVLKTLFRAPTETVAVSVALARVIDRYRNTPSSVIGNGVMSPIGSFPEKRDLAAELRLIGVGGILPRKGPVEAVETLAELRARGVNAHLTWVGEGEARSTMLSRASDLGVTSHLTLTGQLSPELLSRELLAADLFLLPVETETFGVAIAEAMSHGLPVVVTGTGGHEEFLIPEASRLVAEREAGLLADAVQELVASPQLWERARIAEHTESLFSRAHRKQQYSRVYDRAAAAYAKR